MGEPVGDHVNIPDGGIWGGIATFTALVIWAAREQFKYMKRVSKAPGQVRELAQIIEEVVGWTAEDLRRKTEPLTPTENNRLGTIEKIQDVLRRMEIGEELGNGH